LVPDSNIVVRAPDRLAAVTGEKYGMDILTESLTIERFLSFDEPQTLGPMGPVAAIIGRNNVGNATICRCTLTIREVAVRHVS
jgi:hypothetical protein